MVSCLFCFFVLFDRYNPFSCKVAYFLSQITWFLQSPFRFHNKIPFLVRVQNPTALRINFYLACIHSKTFCTCLCGFLCHFLVGAHKGEIPSCLRKGFPWCQTITTCFFHNSHHIYGPAYRYFNWFVGSIHLSTNESFMALEFFWIWDLKRDKPLKSQVLTTRLTLRVNYNHMFCDAVLWFDIKSFHLVNRITLEKKKKHWKYALK